MRRSKLSDFSSSLETILESPDEEDDPLWELERLVFGSVQLMETEQLKWESRIMFCPVRNYHEIVLVNTAHNMNRFDLLNYTIELLKLSITSQEQLQHICETLARLARGETEDLMHFRKKDIHRITYFHLKKRVRTLMSKKEDSYSDRDLQQMSKFERERILFRRNFNVTMEPMFRVFLKHVHDRVDQLKANHWWSKTRPLFYAYRCMMKHYNELLVPDFLFLFGHVQSENFRDLEFFTLCGIHQISRPTLTFNEIEPVTPCTSCFSSLLKA